MVIRPCIASVIVVLVFAGCGAGKIIAVDTSLSDAELIQRGQEAFDLKRYRQAIQYYTAVLERSDPYSESFFAAEYEVAFVHYKMKDYKTAQTKLEEILANYENTESELYPAQYRILSRILLESIAEKTKS
ncbi:MAG: hypothetical protein LBO67_10140 [Spirochaetaceae bacterium]|jgi:outer membrane protein assembly factor BamD (BamD/ComL family)|nr:hypothetical protein [Spirochaetaceae bacterium]